MDVYEEIDGETRFDFRVRDEGTVVLLEPINDYARAWIDESLYGDEGERPQWWGGSVVIDHRCAGAILDALMAGEYRVYVE